MTRRWQLFHFVMYLVGLGLFVSGAKSLSDGAWERGVPLVLAFVGLIAFEYGIARFVSRSIKN